ncbi:MAG: hypothetical protein QN187_17935 [Armatimonadota bacterium]|nr:hypothetical protein [Armatimonadota bacterium]
MKRLRTLAALFALAGTCATAQQATPTCGPPDCVVIPEPVQTREAARIRANVRRLAQTPMPTVTLRCRTPAPGITCCEYVQRDWRGTDIPTAIGCFPMK